MLKETSLWLFKGNKQQDQIRKKSNLQSDLPVKIGLSLSVVSDGSINGCQYHMTSLKNSEAIQRELTPNPNPLYEASLIQFPKLTKDHLRRENDKYP